MFGDHYPIIMTEKDAVKCVAFADERAWFLPVTASLSEAFRQAILSKLPNQRGDI